MQENPVSASLKIVPFEWRDLDALMAIEIQVFTAPWSRESYTQLIPQEVIFVWVAKSDQQLVGYMLYQLWEEEMELHTIGVDPLFQGKGVGRALMQKLRDEALVRGVCEIYLQVRVSNARAIHLYEHFGFSRSGLRKAYYQDNDEDAFVMRCEVLSLRGA